jgi:4-oxalocrotonate tautomerase
MPFINIRIAPGDISDKQADQLISSTTALMRNVMKKKAERTTVHIQPENAKLWAVGGKKIADRSGRAVFMDINITQGTNVTADKVAMVEQCYAMLSEVLGTIPEATYIVIHEIPGESWGKAGIMMYERAAADRKEAAASVE